MEKYSYIIQSLISFEKEVNGLQKIEKILDVLKKNLKRIIPLKSSDLFFFDENKSELKSLIEEFDYTLYKSVNRFYKEGVELLLRLVDNIVDVSQINSGEMQTEIHLYNVNRILEYVVEELKQSAELNSIRIDLHLDDENKFIETDEIHLKKILFALI